MRNFTVSWSDGRAFAYLLHHYHPQLLRRDVISDNTTQTQTNESQTQQRDSVDARFMFSFAGDDDQGLSNPPTPHHRDS